MVPVSVSVGFDCIFETEITGSELVARTANESFDVQIISLFLQLIAKSLQSHIRQIANLKKLLRVLWIPCFGRNIPDMVKSYLVYSAVGEPDRSKALNTR